MSQRHSHPSVPPSHEALFRYRLVSEIRARVLSGEPLVEAVAHVAQNSHHDFHGNIWRPSTRSLYRWVAAYKTLNFQGLQPVSRMPLEGSVVLPRKLLDFIAIEKQLDRGASIPELMRRAREHGVVAANQPLHRSTVYRTLKRMQLPVGRRKKRRPDRDTRRFAYPHRMDMVLCDGKHFRAGPNRARRLALFFLDDASRYVLHVVVGTEGESTKLFLRGLYGSIRNHGTASIYYLDHGPGFISDDTVDVIRKLDALLIHGESAYPEGHGKIERFNQTVKNDVLRGYDGRPDVNADPAALELRLSHYLREVYNQRPHESLGNITPSERFLADERPLRLSETEAELRQRFVVHFDRRVSADHVVSVFGVDYEIPQGHAGEKIVIHHHLLDQKMAVLHDQKLVTITPVDLVANAYARRARPPAKDDGSHMVLPKSSADLVFERDLSAIVDADGGFADTSKE
jgi:transposase InsO family protein